MNLLDFKYLNDNLQATGIFGSDASVANMFLLQEKYNTELKIRENVLIRYYYGDENRTGYAFPLFLKKDIPLKQALEIIFDDAAQQKRPVSFCLITQEQKRELDLCLAEHFQGRHVEWKTNRDDCDYIYLRENLAGLLGSRYQKKRNHISRFNRIYGTNWEFKLYPQNDIADDILAVSQKWYNEKDGELKEVLRLEYESIQKALDNTQLLGLIGGVLYINGEPAAMTLAAPISADVLDVIYEKAVAEHEKNGAYAVINQQFARKGPQSLYYNREEDMGVEGLRKAKLSYKPDMILDKFYGRVE
ncbi:MAG: DUF2156 domain-containing protein [Treponema sp.]|nr:DUF2156 domain-containing protein [Treponema sp.]